jgi:hypothetical protein
MSKGLGKLQREIISHLADPIPATGWSREGELRAGGVCFIPVPGVYDLRSVSHTMARQRGLKFVDWSPPLQAAFSRAVRSMVRRGILEKVELVPVERVTYWERHRRCSVHELSDGCFLDWSPRQVRFVRLKDEPARLDSVRATGVRR